MKSVTVQSAFGVNVPGHVKLPASDQNLFNLMEDARITAKIKREGLVPVGVSIIGDINAPKSHFFNDLKHIGS